MLTLAANICTEEFRPLWNVVGIIINVIWIGVPIILIVLGSIDLGKADEFKKAKKSLLNRFLYAVLVFCVVWIVQIVMGAISKIGIEGSDTTSWANCWKLIRE